MAERGLGVCGRVCAGLCSVRELFGRLTRLRKRTSEDVLVCLLCLVLGPSRRLNVCNTRVQGCVLSLEPCQGHAPLVLLSACHPDGSSLEGPEAGRQWIMIPPSRRCHLPFPRGRSQLSRCVLVSLSVSVLFPSSC